jgi:two-component system chemotaxis response regulator CheY
MKTCLVVDDSRVIRKVARKIVEDHGVCLRRGRRWPAGSGRCRKTMPDAVLLDWNMPVMNGLDFLIKLREEPERQEAGRGVLHH